MTPTLTALTLGLLIGAQHAFEPDHLAAVGTMLPGETSPMKSALRGGWWGLGHGLAIAAVGIPLILLGLEVPEHIESIAEFVVGVMLIGLGVRALRNARRALRPDAQPHHHHNSLPIGLVHGLAGSGAAVVLATADAPTPAISMLFLAVFILGSTLSMAGTAALISLPIARAATNERRTSWLLTTSGLLSVGVGLMWGAPHVIAWAA